NGAGCGAERPAIQCLDCHRFAGKTRGKLQGHVGGGEAVPTHRCECSGATVITLDDLATLRYLIRLRYRRVLTQDCGTTAKPKKNGRQQLKERSCHGLLFLSLC